MKTFGFWLLLIVIALFIIGVVVGVAHFNIVCANRGGIAARTVIGQVCIKNEALIEVQ